MVCPTGYHKRHGRCMRVHGMPATKCAHGALKHPTKTRKCKKK